MATPSVRQKAIRRTGSSVLQVNWAYLIGMGLFYTYMLIPARLQELISIFRLEAPAPAKAYGLGYPYLTILELMMLGYAVLMWIFKGGKFIIKSRALVLYVVISLACALFLWVRYVKGDVPEMYWDSALAAIRLVAIYGLFVSIPNDTASWIRTFQNALALLFVASLLFNLAGFANPNTVSNEAGRLNASGLDFSTTGYWGGILALSSLTLSKGMRQLGLFFCGMLGVAMGGGRNPIPFFVISLAILALQRHSIRRSLIWILCGVGVVLLLILIFAPYVLIRLPVLNRVLDYSVYYPYSVTPTDTALKYFPFLEQFPLSDPAIIGRFNAWSSALHILEDEGLLPLGSDWYVQQKLMPAGIPSHSHNGYLQTLLKFGLLALPIWALLAAGLWRGLRARSPYSVLILFLMASLLVDYWLLVTKSAFLFFALVRLNDDWLKIQNNKERVKYIGHK